MFRIGEFSKIAQVSGRLLRYYDEIGLFSPIHIDKFTGFRYYSAEQMSDLNRILALKDLGLTLDQIQRVLRDNISPDEMQGMLLLKKAEIEQLLQDQLKRIRGIESGGAVENLPSHTFPTDDGGVDMKCPTEIAISDRREAELSKNGFLAMIHRKNSDFAAFIGAQSLQKPTEYDDPDATSNAALAARLPYLFACNRFAHYLKCMVRDKVGSFKTREAMERWLNDWIIQYVDGDPANSSEQTKSERPLAAAEVVVEEVEGAPGYYQSKFFLKPHYQLEGLSVSLRLVSKLPSEKT